MSITNYRIVLIHETDCKFLKSCIDEVNQYDEMEEWDIDALHGQSELLHELTQRLQFISDNNKTRKDYLK